MATQDVINMVARIAKRSSQRPEAQLQADIYTLLTIGGLQIGDDDVARLEVQTGDGTRRRLDIEVGHCCIEVKKDLTTGNVLAKAKVQLAGYVLTRSQDTGARYVGILTDGVSWQLYRLVDKLLEHVVTFTASESDPDALLLWLESVLATRSDLFPTSNEIRDRLGATSPAHKLDHATLADIYQRYGAKPEVQVKKSLWSKLLRTAFGSAFTSSNELFIDHTLLVLTAEAIAHATLGFSLTDGSLSADDIARGTKFQDAQIFGVVEEDFFDWVLEVDGGPDFVRGLVQRVGRFRWPTDLEHDVLKALYTSVLPTEAREALGEYYTPDWLAEQMVQDVYTSPGTQRLLEPSCGSGTFLLHAVRAHLEAREAAGDSVGEAVQSLVNSVIGMDVHPVAVILARVTYVMAIGHARLLDDTRGPMSVPVYLGDSIQWEQRADLLTGASEITIRTDGDDLTDDGQGQMFVDELRFPRTVLADANNFDQLVTSMADRAITATKSAGEVMAPILRQRGIYQKDDQRTLIETFDTMRRLHNQGRNHIWGYYIRNLVRPLWLAEPANRVDVLVGNPPWLRYNKMTEPMQIRYRVLARERNLLSGGLGASARDLATLFVARATELYLKLDGRFAFVMPHGTLSRRPHAGFRSGNWSSKSVQLHAAFGDSWDLDKVTTGFPMSSCVVRGSTSTTAVPLTTSVVAWEGHLANPDLTWSVARRSITRRPGSIAILADRADQIESPYRSAFRQGAILVPRYLLCVTENPGSNPLGAGAGRVAVESLRSTQEKEPWKNHPSITGTVERRFIYDVYLGESVAPFRTFTPRRAVLPIDKSSILVQSRIDEVSGLSNWWAKVEDAWEQGRKPSEQQALLDRFDYHAQLRSQLPGASQRVLYSKAGNTLTAARLANSRAVIDHKLYWATTVTVAEALYLVAILNSSTLLRRVAPLQARGLFGARDFDKHVFEVPIPTFDSANVIHTDLADLASRAEEVAANVIIDPTTTFQANRLRIRQALIIDGLAAEIEALVDAIVPSTA